MGRVKQWVLEQQENTMARYADGEIDSKECVELLAELGMDTDDIESAIDNLTADHTKAVADKAIGKAKSSTYSMWKTPHSDWTTRKKQ